MINKEIPQDRLPRIFLNALKEDIKGDEITLLLGARQTGKSSLIFLVLNWLLQERGKAPSQFFYFDLENIIEAETLNQIRNFDNFPRLLKDKGADLNQRTWVIIDEVQYLDHPSSLLKYVYDHWRGKIKFIVSGSSTLEIKQKFTDRLTGRVHTFHVPTLSFEEYLLFKKQDNLLNKKQEFDIFSLAKNKKLEIPSWASVLKDDFLNMLENFCVFGGYPAVVLKELPEKRKTDLSGIYSLYVRKDIKDLARIEDVKGFNNLVGMLAHQIGSLINESELSNGTGLSRPTIKKYLFILENTFITGMLTPFFTNARLEYIKRPKVYFQDSGLRNTIINNFNNLTSRPDTGHLIENVVFSEIIKKKPELFEVHFWKSESGTEVDFIMKAEEDKLIPIEVKYQTFQKPGISRGMRSFINRYRPEVAFIITRDFWEQSKLNSTKIFWIPAWAI